MHSTLIQDAVLRNLQTIGQSVRRLSGTLRAAYPEIDWRSIIGLRNVLVHDYLGINLERIWEIIERDMPALQRTVDAILRGPGGDNRAKRRLTTATADLCPIVQRAQDMTAFLRGPSQRPALTIVWVKGFRTCLARVGARAAG